MVSTHIRPHYPPGAPRSTTVWLPRCGGNRGFSLIELLCAMGILLVVLVGLVPAFYLAMAQHTGSRARRDINQLLEAESARCDALAFDALPMTKQEHEVATTSGLYRITVEARSGTPHDAAAALKTVTITVTPAAGATLSSWARGGAQISYLRAPTSFTSYYQD